MKSSGAPTGSAAGMAPLWQGHLVSESDLRCTRRFLGVHQGLARQKGRPDAFWVKRIFWLILWHSLLRVLRADFAADFAVEAKFSANLAADFRRFDTFLALMLIGGCPKSIKRGTL